MYTSSRPRSTSQENLMPEPTHPIVEPDPGRPDGPGGPDGPDRPGIRPPVRPDRGEPHPEHPIVVPPEPEPN